MIEQKNLTRNFSLFTFTILLMASATAKGAETLDVAFWGRWVALSKACIAGSKLVIEKESFSQADESPIRFKVNPGANANQAWLEDERAQADPKFYRLKIESTGDLKFTYAERINPGDSENGYSSCWYKRASEEKPVKVKKHSTIPKK